MKRLLGGLFESTHLIGSAILFAVALALTALTVPDVLEMAELSIESGSRAFDKLTGAVKSYGTWVAGLALLTGLLAPYVRADDGKAIAWMRILTAGGTTRRVGLAQRDTAGDAVVDPAAVVVSGLHHLGEVTGLLEQARDAAPNVDEIYAYLVAAYTLVDRMIVV